jgi:hypothetical protein
MGSDGISAVKGEENGEEDTEKIIFDRGVNGAFTVSSDADRLPGGRGLHSGIRAGTLGEGEHLGREGNGDLFALSRARSGELLYLHCDRICRLQIDQIAVQRKNEEKQPHENRAFPV